MFNVGLEKSVSIINKKQTKKVSTFLTKLKSEKVNILTQNVNLLQSRDSPKAELPSIASLGTCSEPEIAENIVQLIDLNGNLEQQDHKIFRFVSPSGMIPNKDTLYIVRKSDNIVVDKFELGDSNPDSELSGYIKSGSEWTSVNSESEFVLGESLLPELQGGGGGGSQKGYDYYATSALGKVVSNGLTYVSQNMAKGYKVVCVGKECNPGSVGSDIGYEASDNTMKDLLANILLKRAYDSSAWAWELNLEETRPLLDANLGKIDDILKPVSDFYEVGIGENEFIVGEGEEGERKELDDKSDDVTEII